LSSTPFKKKEFAQEAFDQMLTWLNPDREEAGKKYEDIRKRLITIFTCRGCLMPEDLTDETIDRVVMKIPGIAGSYVGDPALYFFGVAKYVFHEYIRKIPIPVPPPVVHFTREVEQQYSCLEECMQELTSKNRELILEYYSDEGDKIVHRKRLAGKRGIELNALRIQACRIRAVLFQCVQECLKRHEKA